MKIQDSKSSNLTLSTSLFEELSEVELEAVSGGAQQEGLVIVNVEDVNVGANVAVLNTKPSQENNFPMSKK